MDKNKELWSKCAAFHGHECGGLTIGYKAVLYALKLLELSPFPQEPVACIAEKEFCGVDAVRFLLGCTEEKGNLHFKKTEEMAFTFRRKDNGKSFRLHLRPGPENMSKAASFAYYQSKEPEELFEVEEVVWTGQ